MQMQADQELNKNFKVTSVVHLVFMVAPVIYALIIAFLADKSMLPQLDERLHAVVLGTVATAAVVLLLVRERLSPAGARAALAKGQSVPEALAAAQLMRSAINETVAVLGLVAFLLTAKMGLSLVFIAVGLFALVRTRPNKDEWRAAATKGRR